MSDNYRIFGSELSPYSVKLRSYCRYKAIPNEWILRNDDNTEEFTRHARLPLIPVVVTPDEEALQDSTPIVEALERRFPEPSIHPEDAALAFISALVEEFADEWGNKWMFHYRWARPVDQDSTAERIALQMMPGRSATEIAERTAAVKSRMLERAWYVGSNAHTAPQIEQTFNEFIGQLDAHLAGRLYLFGGRPAFGDFGLGLQVYECWTDPTANAIIETTSSHIVPWIKRMLDPRSMGAFEAWSDLEPTLLPILRDHVGGLFLPWSVANAQALAAGGAEEYTVAIRGGTWRQKPQKYHARSLAVLRERYAAVGDKNALDPILEAAGCRDWLQG